MFFLGGYAGSGSGQTQNIESQIWLYSVCWGGNKWPRRPLGGVNYSAEVCGHCVKVCLVVLLLKRELDSLPECLRGWWSGWPPLLVTMWVIPEDLGNFSPRRKFFGEQKFARLSASNFCGRIINKFTTNSAENSFCVCLFPVLTSYSFLKVLSSIDFFLFFFNGATILSLKGFYVTLCISDTQNKWHSATMINHYAEYFICDYDECHYAECHYAEYHYAECHYAECHCAEWHYAKCYYAECHCAECRGAFKTWW